jgi:hypothetical protein
MSIDRIGKGPGVTPLATGDVKGPSATTGTGETFRVSRAAEATGPSAVERVRAGEISVDQYLDIKVNEATAHLAGKLPADQLAFVQSSLREQLAADPVLVELVERASGATPPSRE